MKIETIETPRLYLRGFERADAQFAISIWNNPEMGEYLADEAMEEIIFGKRFGVDSKYI